MMNNLFSMFDPSSSFMSMAWVALMITPVVLAGKTKKTPAKKESLINSSMLMVEKEVKQLTGTTNKKSMSKTMMCLFIMVLTLNISAILPFNFTIMAHISTTFALSLTLWGATIINAISNSPKNTLTHLTPMGTPSALMNFMVMIEVVSQLIRPITLSVRLMANMVAGHLLINLLSNYSISSMSKFTTGLTPMMMLLTLEAAVALIQAYVITVLMTLYYSETF